MMTLIQRLLSILALLTLAACGGGGGSAGTAPFGPGAGGGGGGGGGGGVGSPSIALSLSSSSINTNSPATVTVTVRDASGSPVSGVVVSLETSRGDLGQLSVSTLLTDAAGSGSALIQASPGGALGADELLAKASVNGVAINSSIGFAVTGAAATLNATISTATLRPSAPPAVVTAVARDSQGNPLGNQIVNFASANGRVTLSAVSALTDSTGTASVIISPRDTEVGVTDSITVSSAINGRAIQSLVNVQILPEIPAIELALSSPTTVTGSPSQLTATVKNAAGQPVANAVVTFSTQFNLASFAATTALTDIAGRASVAVTPRLPTLAGAEVLIGSVTLSGVTRSAQRPIDVLAGTSGEPVLQLALSSPTVTPTAPSQLALTLRDASGSPIRGVVVSLSTQRGGLATLSAQTVLTDNNGSGTVQLRSAASGSEGADDVIATAVLGTQTIQGRVGFTAVAATPTLQLTPPLLSALRFSAGNTTLTATVRNADGQLVSAGQLVSFSVAGSGVTLGATSAVTNANGQAQVTARASTPTGSGVVTLTASTTVGGRALLSQSQITLAPEAPALEQASISTVNLSPSAPAIWRVRLLGLAGAAQVGTAVTFSSQSGLLAFSPVSAVTNASGEASVTATPRLPVTPGTDTLIARATVEGVEAVLQSIVTLSPGVSTGSPTLNLALSSNAVTPAAAAQVQVTVRDALGNPLPNAVVNLSTPGGILASLSPSTVLTGSNGTAIATLSHAGSGVGGADEVVASTTVNSAQLSARTGFSVEAASARLSMQPAFIDALRFSAGEASITATLVGADSQPVGANQVVNFSSSATTITLSAPSALTDAQGRAQVRVASVNPANAGVVTVSASATVSGRVLQGQTRITLQPEKPSVESVSITANTSSPSAPATWRVRVRGLNDAPLRSAVVTFSSQLGLVSFTPAVAVTNELGEANVVVAPRQPTSSGQDILIAATVLQGVQASIQQVLTVIPGSTTGTPELGVELSTATISPTAPSQVTVSLRDANGNARSGVVVSLATQRGNLASLSTNSVLTGADGTGSATLSAGGTGILGADEIIATATLAGAQVQGRAGFTVSNNPPPRVTFTPSTISGLRFTDAPQTLTVSVLNASGSAVGSGVRVSLEASAPGLVISPSSAQTNANGQVSFSAKAAEPSQSGLIVISASAEVAGRLAEGQLNVTLEPQAPQLESVSISNSTIESPASAQWRVRVRGLTGAPLTGTVVSFGSRFGLAGFTPASIVTNGDGEGVVTVRALDASSSEADILVATAAVQGVSAFAERAVEFAPGAATGAPRLILRPLNPNTISGTDARPVVAELRNAQGQPEAGRVVTFSVVRGLGVTNVATALTKEDGTASVLLSPASSLSAGADEITATTNLQGSELQATLGFEVNATPVTLLSFTSPVPQLSAYGQTTLTLTLAGASATSPVSLSVSSSCVTQGKAVLSPASFVATSNTVTLQYRDNGCGAVQDKDTLLAVVNATNTQLPLEFDIARPTENSIAFVSASPELIFIRGSGFVESSNIVFEVRDVAGNALPNLPVTVALLTGAGGVTLQDKPIGEVIPPLQSDALGQVVVRVNAGSQPTPVRIQASITTPNGTISTVSSNLSVAVGLPSQLNFSLSQQTRNIEGYNIDGTPNTYQIIAADRSGNPVPDGTSINFITREGGQVEPVRQTTIVNGIARTVAQFVSSDPRPVDGRLTVLAYALGEESFIDLNGNNIFDTGEPFQDLGNVYVDRYYDDSFDALLDEYIPLNINNAGVCMGVPALYLPILEKNANIPSVPNTCSGNWSGAGQVYVRRAVETVLSTSAARPLWNNDSGLTSSCRKLRLQDGSDPTAPGSHGIYTAVVNGATWYGGRSGTLSFIVADNNPGRLKPSSEWTGPVLGSGPTFNPLQDYELFPRLNPMAAGSTITATTPTTGLTLTVGGGSPVPSTTEATAATIAYSFEDPAVSSGVIFVTFRSPSGVGTTVSVPVEAGAAPSACPP